MLFAWELTTVSYFPSFHQTMWIERTTYTTAYTFPGILKWFEVKQISTVSYLKVKLRKLFLSPNRMRAFVKFPLQFSLAPLAHFIFQKRNKRHACRIELLCQTDVTTPTLKITPSEWLFYDPMGVVSSRILPVPKNIFGIPPLSSLSITFFSPRTLPLIFS